VASKESAVGSLRSRVLGWPRLGQDQQINLYYANPHDRDRLQDRGQMTSLEQSYYANVWLPSTGKVC
jgi:hypothetical protein